MVVVDTTVSDQPRIQWMCLPTNALTHRYVQYQAISALLLAKIKLINQYFLYTYTLILYVWNIHILKDIISLSFMLIVLDQESSCLFCQLSHRNTALQDCSVICPVIPSSFIQTPSCGDRGTYLTHGSVSRTSPHSRTASRSGLAKICRDAGTADAWTPV